MSSLVSRNVRSLMHAQQVSQAQLAATLGVSQAAVSKKLRAGRWTVDELVELAGILHVRPAVLSGWEAAA